MARPRCVSTKDVTAGLAALLILCLMMPTGAQATTDAQRCMLNFLDHGSDDLTLGEIRNRCVTPPAEPPDAPEEPEEPGAVENRLRLEREAGVKPFSILAHRPNYVLPAAYNFEGWDSTLYRNANDDPDYRNEDVEMQFQFSLKVPLAVDLLDGRMDIYAAYTNRSFWQAYDRSGSEPFRETNHEPELWAQFRNSWDVFGFTNVLNTVGWIHQSNGQPDPLSRSWNRVYANFIFERDNLVLGFRPWVWVSRDRAESDNPDITDFMGHGEFRAVWQRNGHVFSGMLRNQIESGFDKGALELAWSFPVFDYPYLKGYLQYFYGYGESLIDYNHKVNRIGLGISVSDWLD